MPMEDQLAGTEPHYGDCVLTTPCPHIARTFPEEHKCVQTMLMQLRQESLTIQLYLKLLDYICLRKAALGTEDPEL
jgi:hypothetical protein